ncbi:T-complex protein 1 subunit gamma [Sparganum proliferum]
MRGVPVVVLNPNTKREHGRDVQMGNIQAGKTVADVIRTCLGPRAMLKMLMDPMGGIKQIHPTRVISAFRQALEDILTAIDTKFSIPIDIPGGSIEDSTVLDGVMFNKDILHPKMKRRIENPRILLLDCSLEYKKGESQTAMEISGEKDFTRALEIEEEYINKICEDIIRHKPTVVITEKGVSDLAQHFLVKAGISVIRRLRKTDCLRIGRCCGATIVSRTEEIKEEDIGTEAGLFEVKLIGDEYFTFITGCKNPKACSIVLRGASKDVLNEIERNLNDAMSVVRSVGMEQRLVPGGGALEMALAQELSQKAKTSVSGIQQVAYLAVAQALEVIPRTLAQNCGANVLRQITELRAYHAIDPAKNWTMGVDGETGQLVDMKTLGVWDPVAVKSQTFKTAIETAILLLRIDDIVSGTKKASDADSKKPGQGDNLP